MKKTTIKSPVSIKGVGLHGGKSVTLTLNPAADNHGIKFKRTDLPEYPEIPADVGYVKDTNRGTKLMKGTAEVGTVEHLMSALYAMGIDNVLVELDAGEVPIMDGSALPFVNMIKEAGIEEQEAERDYFVCEEPISYTDEETGAELMLIPSDKYEVTTMIDFDSPVLGQQYAELGDMSQYDEQIAPCKTFVFVHELVSLIDQDLIKGGDLDNAIVIIGKIVATKPGHAVNIELAKLIKKEIIAKRKLKGKPKYDPNEVPLMNIEQVKAMLPHRYPFLMIDKILELTSEKVVGVKNVTGNENFFQGHFPGNPVFPGVLQMEALAQTGGILALATVEDPQLYDTYFLKMDNVKFKQMVLVKMFLLMHLHL